MGCKSTLLTRGFGSSSWARDRDAGGAEKAPRVLRQIAFVTEGDLRQMNDRAHPIGCLFNDEFLGYRLRYCDDESRFLLAHNYYSIRKKVASANFAAFAVSLICFDDEPC